MSSTGMNEWEPARQPRAAPRASDSKHTSFLQQHEGFIRFLKQHASPPHHRVTAGGRIVPTGPLSPPPMFDYASLNGLLEGQPARTQGPAGGLHIFPDHSDSEEGLASSHIKAQTSYPVFQGHQAPATHSMNPGMQYFPQPFMNSISQSLPSSFALTPLGVFPDGTALISCNGICYRCFWNGVTTVMEPLTTGQPLLVPNEAPLNDHPMPVDKSIYNSGIHGNVAPSTLSHPVAVSFRGASTTPNTNTSRTLDATITANSSHSEESSLKAQLTSLDKYMALHHFEIGPSVKTQLVSRRKILVEAIAKFRSNREPSIQTIPIVLSSIDASRKSSAQSVANRIVTGRQRQGHDQSLDKSTNENISFKKCLSPSAPAFVPKSVVASTSSLKLAPVLGKGHASEVPDPPSVTKTLGSSLGGFMKDENLMRKVSSSSEGKSFAEGDPWDPAMKIVPPSMIQYARKYEPNNPGVGKKLCTTIEEFQEAIRRVREQAIMWGCVGGSSKDPAYDAEEDIWYAIKDEYPIPLPTPTPDHITCPRPWNWYDSAFNVNATIEPKINMRAQKLDEISVQSKKAASSRSPSMSMFVPKDRRIEIATGSKGHFSKASLHQPLRVGGQATARSSAASLDQYDTKQQWKNPKEQSFKKSNDSRKESARIDYNPKDPPKRYNQSPPQTKEGANMRYSDTPNVQDRVAQTQNLNTKEIVSPSKLALSAAQKVYSPIGVRSKHPYEMDSCPRTPSSSPNKARSGTFCKEMIPHVNTTAVDQAAKMKQDISNSSTQHQVVMSGLVSPSINGSLPKASHKSAEPETLVWNSLASSESKSAWGPGQYVNECKK